MKQLIEACGCCEGVEILTPLPTANRPGLSALSYRVGTHATFLETMLARLSSSDYPELRELSTRDPSNPAIALLDAWATVADVLTFYQERIANEGYLRTATERRSVLELARLVGYKLRPGVASSVYLAYTLDDNSKDEVVIPAGARSQSVPGPGELPQSFEISEDLKARAEWNNLKPRMTKPQTAQSMQQVSSSSEDPRVYLKGITTNLKLNDPLLIETTVGQPELFRVMDVQPEAIGDRTKVMMQPWLTPGLVTSAAPSAVTTELSQVLSALLKARSVPPPNRLRLDQNIEQAFAAKADTVPQLLTTLRPELQPILYKAWRNIPVTPATTVKVYALRTHASVFGHNAPLEPIKNRDGVVVGSKEWDLKKSTGVTTEDFRIETKIVPSEVIIAAREIQESRFDITAFVTIGSNPLKIDKRPLKSETFDIDFPQALDKITVSTKVSPSGVEGNIQILCIYTFHNRPLVISLTYDPDTKTGGWIVSSDGSDPTKIATTSSAGVTFVMGTRQVPSLSQTTEEPTVVFLDAPYGQIIPGSWIVLERPNAVANIGQIVISRVVQASERSRADYGITAKGTRIKLGKPWLDLGPDTFAVIRGTSVFAQSDLLELAEEPIDPVKEAVCNDEIELEGLYAGLESGRWLIVSGERTDVVPTTQQASDVQIEGVPASELVMLAGVEQDFDINLPGDKTHSRLLLAIPMAYCYKRDTVTIYGNVVKATHGETRKEVLGSGDAAKALQAFTLKQPPLTFVSASNPSGVDSTLKVFVNDIKWHESDSLAGLSSTDRNFITKTDDESKATVIFGNGKEGARLPTGIENIKSEYRNGIGKPGNVKAGQISLLMTRPLGVKEVLNPLRASGGADKENRDQARKNAPLAVKALDRLVSVQDYADFARTYAGIGKARAEELSDGRRQLVHVTIAGADDIRIDETSDLFQNLRQALHDFGDPFQPIQLAVRELMLLIISARVRILLDYQWEPVVTELRAALLDAFSFERRELGQDVLLSEVISVMQGVRGVAYVDVDVFGGVPEKTVEAGERRLLTPEEISAEVQELVGKERPESRLPVNLAALKNSMIRPAQLAFLTPDVPATLILNQIT